MFKKITIISLLLLLVAPVVSAYLPSDPLWSQQHYLRQINAQRAWDYAKGQGVVVAVMDSGVDINHPDLEFNIWRNIDEVEGDGIDNDKNGYIDDVHGWDFVENSPDPRPKFEDGYSEAGMNHGTAIAGLIGAVANNGKGITGLAFYSKIMPLRVLSSTGSGDVSNLIKAIEYAVNNGADIINLSLVGLGHSENLQSAIEWANDHGVLVVAASGNGDSDLSQELMYPACYGTYDNNIVLTASSVDSLDVKSGFSNYGSVCVDMVAPGENIRSLSYQTDEKPGFEDPYAYNWSGTSFSAALVSGAAALVKSKNTGFTPEQIILTLLATAKNIDDKNPEYEGLLGRGRLDAGLALAAVLESGSGYVVKTKDHPAVYYVSNNKRYLFSNEATYWTWYQGDWSDQNVKILTQEEFDLLSIGQNITVRPGTDLIKFENSPRLYSVMPDAKLCRLANEKVADELYGQDWRDGFSVIQNSFEMNYQKDGDCLLTVESDYPNGTVIRYKDQENLWYIEKGVKRKILTAGFIENNFNMDYIIGEVDNKMVFPTGRPIDAWEKNIYKYNK